MTNEAGRTPHVVEKNCGGSDRPGRRADQAMSSLILKRSPIGLKDYEVLEDSVVVGRIFLAHWTERPALDVGDPRPQGAHADARP